MYPATTEVEATLLASISDDGVRGVYADWLEERGDLDRAELLRVFEELRRDPRNPQLQTRLAFLSCTVDPAWRAYVLRGPGTVDVLEAEPRLPPPRPAAIQLDAPAPDPAPRRPDATVRWLTTRYPVWLRPASRLAWCAIVLSFVLYWLS